MDTLPKGTRGPYCGQPKFLSDNNQSLVNLLLARRREELGEAAFFIYDKIGHGYLLAVPREASMGKLPSLIELDRSSLNSQGYDFHCVTSWEIADRLTRGHYLHELAKERVGDKHSYRRDWEEMGLPGDTHRFFTLIQ